MDLAQGYLGAEGWDVRTRGRDLLVGDRVSRRSDDEKDHIYVWVPSEMGTGFDSREGPYLRRFQEATEEHPTAEKVLLVETLAGLSSEFRTGAKRWYGVKISTDAQFFDTNMRWEIDQRSASAGSELRNRGAKIASERIKQPFRVVGPHEADDDPSGADLLDVLCNDLRNSRSSHDRPTIHIVVGPAGMGKSVLFETLYARLYDEFQADKRAHHLSARPFALLREYLEDAASSTIASLLEAYLRTEFAKRLDSDQFNWKLIHGMGIWLLDGLDEVLERDPGFFDNLEDLMTMPESVTTPSIVICVRDSLFTTHSGLRDFCEEYAPNVTVYRLEGWQQQSKSDFANIKLKSVEAAQDFVENLSRHPAIDELASTPYYCDLLLDEFAEDGEWTGESEIEILERGLTRLIARERDKDLLSDIPDQGIRDFLESCAVTDLLHGGVPVDEVREYAEVVIPGGIPDDELDRLATQMGQIAVFAQGADGRLRFAQEPLEHYLAANYLAQSLETTPQSLGGIELPENVLRLMLSCIDPDALDSVWNLLVDKMSEKSVAGRNALRLAVGISAGTDRLADIQFAGLNLSRVRFDGHDLRGVSFAGADLTNTDFGGADLTGASLDNCLIKCTRFDADPETLTGIEFGEMHRFHSAYVGDRFVDDAAELGGAAGESSDRSGQATPACAAARQLRQIFGKFVEETGRGRRKHLDKRAVLRGKHIVSYRQDILDEAIRAGYLRDTARERIRRAEDDQYSEMVKFRTDLQMSSGIRALLNETCKEPGCSHVR